MSICGDSAAQYNTVNSVWLSGCVVIFGTVQTDPPPIQWDSEHQGATLGKVRLGKRIILS